MSDSANKQHPLDTSASSSSPSSNYSFEDSPPRDPQAGINAVAMWVAQQINSGQRRNKIVDDLAARANIPRGEAEKFVSQIYGVRRSARRSSALKSIGVGVVIAIIGIVITAATYAAAASNPGGGSYVVAWGAVIFGGFQAIRGIFAYLSA